MKHIDFENAVKSFGVQNFVLAGVPKNEQDFYARFKIVTKVNYEAENEYETDISKYPFTYSQLVQEAAKQEQIRLDKDYQLKRAREYPSIGDQLDDLFKSGAFSEQMTAKIKAVKDKYPKPE
jgi:hypothetical protein